MINEEPKAAKCGERLGATYRRKSARARKADAETRENFLVEDRRWNARWTGVDNQSNRVRPDVDYCR